MRATSSGSRAGQAELRFAGISDRRDAATDLYEYSLDHGRIQRDLCEEVIASINIHFSHPDSRDNQLRDEG